MIIKDNTNGIILGVMEINHSSEELLSFLDKIEWYADILKNKNEQRKREQLTVRLLIKKLLGEEKRIIYLEEGKPKLEDESYHISISHTKEYIAVILNKKKKTGIDIEHISPRVKKIRSRFMNQTEEDYICSSNELIHLLLHWSAKETIYKVLDYTDIDFKNHIHIDKFKPVLNEWAQFSAQETRTPEQESFSVDYFVTKDYVLTAIK